MPGHSSRLVDLPQVGVKLPPLVCVGDGGLHSILRHVGRLQDHQGRNQLGVHGEWNVTESGAQRSESFAPLAIHPLLRLTIGNHGQLTLMACNPNECIILAASQVCGSSKTKGWHQTLAVGRCSPSVGLQSQLWPPVYGSASPGGAS